MGTFGTILLLVIAFFLICAAITNFIAAAAKAAVPKIGKTTRVRGGEIHWVESGQGRPIVMIHGLGANLRNFTYALTGKLDDEFRVIALDRAGCGWSERDSAAQATLPEQARMVAEFIEKEGLENPVVVGHSLGGAVALTLGLNHKEVVGSLALLCPATQPIDETPEVFKGLDISSAGLRKFIATTISGPLGLLMEKKIFGVVFAPEPIAPDFFVKGGGKLGRSPGAFVSASEDMVYGRGSVDEVAGRESELTMPVGVLFAEADEILDPKLHGQKFASLSGANLKMLPNRGHMIPLTAPDDCAAFIREMAQKSASDAPVAA